MRKLQRDKQAKIASYGEVYDAGETFSMAVMEKDFENRKLPGRALMTEILAVVQLQREGEHVLAQIGGFDLTFGGERFGRGDGYRYATMLKQTAADYEIDLAVTVTPLGAISCHEHALGTFAFAEELTEKRTQLLDLEKQLAANDDAPLPVDAETTDVSAVSA